MNKAKLVIIGNGIVGHRYIEELVDKANIENYDVTVFCEEPRVHTIEFTYHPIFLTILLMNSRL